MRVHTFTSAGSWIYSPKVNGIKLLVSNDGINFTLPDTETITTEGTDNVLTKITFTVSQKTIQAKFIKVIAENYGIIPAGYPGASNAAWLFVDEVEVL